MSNFCGFNVVRGSCVTARETMTERQQRDIDSILAAHSIRFHERFSQPSYPVPSLLKLMLFRKARTSIRLMLDENNCDFTYYRDNGWFESDYFYPTHLNCSRRLQNALDSIRVLDQTPHLLFWDADGLGYIFMGFSTLFAAQTFTKEGLEKWLRWFFLANALMTPLVGVVYFYPVFSVTLLFLAFPWGITAPGSMLLLALFFRKES